MKINNSNILKIAVEFEKFSQANLMQRVDVSKKKVESLLTYSKEAREYVQKVWSGLAKGECLFANKKRPTRILLDKNRKSSIFVWMDDMNECIAHMERIIKKIESKKFNNTFNENNLKKLNDVIQVLFDDLQVLSGMVKMLSEKCSCNQGSAPSLPTA